MKPFRYPGAKPFSQNDQRLFFGRDADIERLQRMISLETLTVLFGKSGTGKTSLLQAGILPRLEAGGERLQALLLRFGAYQAGTLSPVEAFVQRLGAENSPAPLLQKLGVRGHSLWSACKQLQLSLPPQTGLYLILDQFEEIFTYPETQVETFKQQLAELLSNALPDSFRFALKVRLEQDKGFFSAEELDQLYNTIPLHLILAIRSDRLSLLSRFRSHLPDILQHCYELEALNAEQAREAITRPARAEGDFETAPFQYEPDALGKIVEFLLSRRDNEDAFAQANRVESTNLQIICEFVERQIVMMGDTSVGPEDLGDLEQVLENYYLNLLNSLSLDAAEMERVRVFIEDGLIFEDDRRRLALYKGQILKVYQISEALLERLVRSHLLREERYTSGGVSYELSHDTLVAPILKAKQRRMAAQRRAERMAEYDKAVLATPADPYAYSHRGYALYYEFQEYEKAIADFSQYISLKPDDTWGYRMRGLAHYQLTHPEEALADFDYILQKLSPAYADIWVDRGNVWYEEKAYEKAISDYEQALVHEPNHYHASRNLGLAYRELKNPEKALQYFSRAIEIDPQSVDALNDRGNLFQSLKRHDEAITDYKRAIEVNASEVALLLNLSVSYFELRDWENVLHYSTQAIAVAPDLPEPYIQHGAAAYYLNRFDAALEDYHQALRLLPGDALIWNNRANCYRRLGDLSRARADAEKANQLDPSYGWAYITIALIESQLGHDEAFFEWLGKAVENGYPMAEMWDLEPEMHRHAENPRFKALLKVSQSRLNA